MTWTAWTRPLCPEIKNVFLSPSFQFINSADAVAVMAKAWGPRREMLYRMPSRSPLQMSPDHRLCKLRFLRVA